MKIDDTVNSTFYVGSLVWIPAGTIMAKFLQRTTQLITLSKPIVALLTAFAQKPHQGSFDVEVLHDGNKYFVKLSQIFPLSLKSGKNDN